MRLPLRRGLSGRQCAARNRGMQTSASLRPRLEGRTRSFHSPVTVLASGGGSGSDPPALKRLGGGGDGEENGGHGAQLPWALLLACGASSLTAAPAHALRVRKRKQPPKAHDINSLIDLAYPILKNLGFSGVLGAIAGICLKTVGRSLAVVVGVFFAVIQVGAYLGYVTVDWARVHRDLIKHLDVNSDGKFDASDLKAIAASLLGILAQGVPSVGGFSAGVALGLRL